MCCCMPFASVRAGVPVAASRSENFSLDYGYRRKQRQFDHVCFGAILVLPIAMLYLLASPVCLIGDIVCMCVVSGIVSIREEHGPNVTVCCESGE